MLEELPAPSSVAKTKVGGIDLNKARMRWVVEALIALCVSPSAQRFTASQLARQVRLLSNQGESDYGPRRAAYDLTIFKLHCGRLTLKIYTKGERVLRIEIVVLQHCSTAMWPLAGEVSSNSDGSQRHSAALYGRLELYRSVLHCR